MQIPCQKGCGRSIEVPLETLQEAEKTGIPIKFEHERCESEPLSNYRVDVVITKKTGEGDNEKIEVLSKIGSDENGKSLSAVFDRLEDGVAEGMAQVRGLLSIIEVDALDTSEIDNKKEGSDDEEEEGQEGTA